MHTALVKLLALVSVCAGTVLDADPNANLFSRLLPVFAKEEEQSIVERKSPLLGGETQLSLEEATRRVNKLVDMGVFDPEKASKLLHSLNFAKSVHHIASLMDGGRSTPRG
jgi:hypothetical protein